MGRIGRAAGVERSATVAPPGGERLALQPFVHKGNANMILICHGCFA